MEIAYKNQFKDIIDLLNEIGFVETLDTLKDLKEILHHNSYTENIFESKDVDQIICFRNTNLDFDSYNKFQGKSLYFLIIIYKKDDYMSAKTGGLISDLQISKNVFEKPNEIMFDNQTYQDVSDQICKEIIKEFEKVYVKELWNNKINNTFSIN